MELNEALWERRQPIKNLNTQPSQKLQETGKNDHALLYLKMDR